MQNQLNSVTAIINSGEVTYGHKILINLLENTTTYQTTGQNASKQESKFSDEEKAKFFQAIDLLKILSWKSEYNCPSFDNTTCTITFTFNDASEKTTICANANPENWKEFWKEVGKLLKCKASRKQNARN